MPVKQSDYETLLSKYSNREAAITLLKDYRPYLEMIPSMRRSKESIITLPLPIARVRISQLFVENSYTPNISQETRQLPAELAILMCDPEWKIKMGVEIIVFIHRPGEDFSQLLSRWRQTQVFLDRDYEWLMPPHDQHIFSEAADRIYPLFVIFQETPERIKQGLRGAYLPCVIETLQLKNEKTITEVLSIES